MKKILIALLLLAFVLPVFGQQADELKQSLVPRRLNQNAYAFALNQNLRTTDSPTFTGLTLSGGTASTLAYLNASKAFTSLANSAGYLLNDGSGNFSFAANVITKTTGNMSVTVGATGDYTSVSAAVAALPDMIDHDVTITIQKGSRYTTDPKIQDLRGKGSLLIQSEKYQSILTADGGGATYLTDASAFDEDDEFNGCWVLVMEGTGKANGFVQITDTVASEGRIYVASWSANPDNTSKYMIVGALFGSPTGTCGFTIDGPSTLPWVGVWGIGVVSTTYNGFYFTDCARINLSTSAVYDAEWCGIWIQRVAFFEVSSCGVISNDPTNWVGDLCGGIVATEKSFGYVASTKLVDNGGYSIYAASNTYITATGNSGLNIGPYGSWAESGSSIDVSGSECSGATGDHSQAADQNALVF